MGLMLKMSLVTTMCYAKFLAQHADSAAFMQQHVAEILSSPMAMCYAKFLALKTMQYAALMLLK